jgi:aminodeoxyfutalosine synthase
MRNEIPVSPVNSPFEIATLDRRLENVISTVENGERLSFEDGMVLETTRDFHGLVSLAHSARLRKRSIDTGYIVNAHLDYTNICISKCRFCVYGVDRSDSGAFLIDPSSAPSLVPPDVDEIHVIGGIDPSLPLNYFIELVTSLHRANPGAVIKAFTAVEIFALAQREHRDPVEILSHLKDAGLGMLPGGGAEIFADEYRKQCCPSKASADDWLSIHRAAHKLGIMSNSTMLYGYIEKPEHRIDHLIRLRELQDETGGFIAHVPLPYIQPGAAFKNGVLDLRQTALARLMLDNFPHIKIYWKAVGLKVAQVGLLSGADDLDGTINREKVMTSSGSDSPQSISADELRRIIVAAGLKPVRRDAFHKPLEGRS